MIAAAPVSACVCEHITESVIQCPEHFKLWRYGKRLTSVSRIVRHFFPMDADIPEERLNNAKLRGREVDALFAQYVAGTHVRIPVGTGKDSRELLVKAIRWFDKQNFASVQTQLVLGCEDYGGILDFVFDGMPVDLKATAKVDHTSRLQVAAYVALMDDDPRPNGAILHVTERLKEARLVPLLPVDHLEWDVLLESWRVIKRRGKVSMEEEE